MNVLLIEMHLIISSKQFELLPAVPSLSTLANKSLLAMRVKMLNEIFDNIETWINNGVGNPYRRKKNYGYSYYPL